MDPNANVAVARRFFDEIVSQHKVDAAEQFLAEDFEDHVPLPTKPGADGFREFAKGMFSAFPDFRARIDDIFAADDKVVVRVHLSGTHKGTFQGVPATGKPVSWPSIQILRFENGKIAERWAEGNMLAVMKQIGAVPAQAGAR